MAFKTILYEARGPLGLITLNRPHKLNAINSCMVEELGKALDLAEGDPQVRVIIVSGTGKAFSAGFDLTPEHDIDWSDRDAVQTEITRDFNMIMRFMESPKPTIAAVHRYCLGGAFELALACDLTVTSADCRFGEPEVRFGSSFIALLLPWVCGSKRARELLLTGTDRVSAIEAKEYGLVNRIAAEDRLLEESMQLGLEIARNDVLAVQLTKQALNNSYNAAGMREALLQGLETSITIESTETEESRQFSLILKTKGTRAAIQWLDERMGTDQLKE